ncbi:DeoR/GlpR family DNA-binding transcription regulator [Velocimicrobium porci]|uniref:DeoR/GlpR transcriptional regulator n=1 Tax=Velocimicrobium porci TaxID=2606634 RepID=A0A6L5XXR4_9FIRM|nr:DeoR/GlpR family DNA-binding transcription regulator [Velocimicrobium porci]MSS63389.1 DeoR/GlpR transcriptional regulator [Velocimicrobium porci]
MLLEERLNQIMNLLEEKSTVTVQELTKLLDSSESTIRRDLTLLDSQGKLKKVHGGATTISGLYSTKDEDIAFRKTLNKEEKKEIVKYAATLIRPNDFVYIDAGTTTEMLIDYITEKQAVYVTNAISHAKKLVERGCKAHIVGGEFKLATEAIVGNETVIELEKYHFTIGFFGTNGIDIKNGFSTPDIREAMVKKKSMEQCMECYILADSKKFNQTSAVTFAPFESATILTTELKDEAYKQYENIMEVKKDDLHRNI